MDPVEKRPTSSIAISSIVFACIFGGALFGISLRAMLPESHVDSSSRDAVRLAMGLVVTMAALVLGFLVASAKGSYDAQIADVTQISAKVILLDRILAHYGPEAKEARAQLRGIVVGTLDRLWPQERSQDSEVRMPPALAERLYDNVQALSPKDNTQRSLQAQASSLVLSLGETRWLMFSQSANSISKPMLVVLVFWLTIIFISFGLYAPINATVISAFLVCGLSVAGAILLIQDLYSPYRGMMTISSAPLRNALAQLGQ